MRSQELKAIKHLAPTNGMRGYKNVDAQAASRRVVRVGGLTEHKGF
ncbi:hypothetical protein H6G74_14755 [Nostoc spongiaeforme FACHB-130]|uniref:Uncharacterized protein n=1 Tax=Nostoc spongiaeforme FACHB-130 TaxID=1357510 RepID=A0ABR8FXC5_9NOSO|nr:hypothetical protein [Nostoc spongiaeforme]MBD2595580.1 hypothetical protein [Nostoc spongiaeforme FACHB-130]